MRLGSLKIYLKTMNILLTFPAKLFFAFCLFLSPFLSFAQVDRTFWFAAPDATSGHNHAPIVMRFATFATPSVVTISMPSNVAFTPIVINIAANSVATRDLTPFLAQIETPFDAGGVPVPRTTGILVESTANITAYYEVNAGNNPDIFALKGVNSLGKNFFLPFQKAWNHRQNLVPVGRTGFVVVATVDNTVVTVTPTLALEGGRAAGVPYSITLNRGQSYCGSVQQPLAGGAPTGTQITANQPIAVTMFHDSINSGTGGCYDLAGDQIIPTNIIGTEYSVQRGFLDGLEQVTIVATESGTTAVSVINASNPVSPTINLTAGGFYTLMLPAADIFTYITSNKKIYVAHYAGFGCEVGAAVLPPLNCTGSRDVRFIRSTGEYAGITLLVKAGNENKFSFNGGMENTDIPASAFTDVPGSGSTWKSARITINLPATTAPMLAAGTAGLVSNSGGLFHLGLINGGAVSGCRYGYFSNFNSVNLGPDISIAYGTTVTLDAGPTGFSYLWSTGETTQTIVVPVYLAGSYIVTVDIGNGCLLKDTVCVGTSEYVWTGFEDSNFGNINNWSRPCGIDALPDCNVNIVVPIPANLKGAKAILNINSTAACRDLWIETDATTKGTLNFTAGGRLNICRHFRHDGIMNTVPNSTIAFIGNEPQRYMFNTTTAVGEFENLIIANTTTPISNTQWAYVKVVNGVNMGNMVVSSTGSLTFQSGYIQTEGSREIIVKNRATNAILGHNLNRFVVGRLRRYTNPTGAYDYPVGLALDVSVAAVDAAKTGTLTNMDAATDWVTANYCTGIGSTRVLDFDGTDDFIQMPVFAQLSGNQPRTIEMWARVRDFAGEAGLFTFGNVGTNLQDFGLRVDNGLSGDNKWRVQHWGADYLFNTNTLNSNAGLLNRWTHYALTYNGTQVCVYINGSLINCTNRNLNTNLVSNFLARWRNGYLNGQIDEVKIWNYARSVSEISANLCVPISQCSTAGLIAYYDFEEGTGSTTITHKDITCIAPSMTYQLANVNYYNPTNADNFLAFFTKYGTVPTLSGQPLSCAADFNCQVLDNGFWTINAFSNPTTQITGVGVTGEYGMILYNRDYTNGLTSCNMGVADKGTIMKRADNASAWGIANGLCTDFNFASTGRSGMTGFSDFATAKSPIPVLLPVELLSFTAIYKGKGRVQTQWETISEKDVDKFVVERSTNGIDFITIGIEKVTANSYSLKSYTFDDLRPKLGINYYRLKTIDLDGKIAYSKIVAVVVDTQNPDNILTLHPNPTPTGSEINITGIEKSEVNVQITTTLGQILYNKTAKHDGGTLSISPHLAAGVYFVKIGTGEHLQVIKVIIE